MDWTTFCVVADELWRIVEPGGVVCWDVADGIENGHLSGTSARQTVYFLDKGFSLHERIIVHKNGRVHPAPTRHGMPVEEVLVLSKGKPNTVTRRTKPNRPESVGKRLLFSKRNHDGSVTRGLGSIIKEFGYRNAIWCYNPLCPECGHEWDGTDKYTTEAIYDDEGALKPFSMYQTPFHFTGAHPARMSAALVRDLILTYSRPGQIVLDPFMGTGTSCEQAFLNHRFYLGMELWLKAFRMAEMRLAEAKRRYYGQLQ
jgi:site-specific DNA-methyltransferase (adenine-specific)